MEVEAGEGGPRRDYEPKPNLIAYRSILKRSILHTHSPGTRLIHCDVSAKSIFTPSQIKRTTAIVKYHFCDNVIPPNHSLDYRTDTLFI